MTTQPTTPETARNATQPDALDLSQTQLLGLFTGVDAPRAMLRGPDGTVTLAHVDDETDIGQIMAITDSYVLLKDGATIRRLTLPA